MSGQAYDMPPRSAAEIEEVMAAMTVESLQELSKALEWLGENVSVPLEGQLPGLTRRP